MTNKAFTESWRFYAMDTPFCQSTMSHNDLVNAILQRSWAEAKKIVLEKPELVYIATYPSFDYVDLDGHGNNHHDEERGQRRSALHELCRQISPIGLSESPESERCLSSDQIESHDLLWTMLHASHRSLGRNAWKGVHPLSIDKSFLELYEGGRDETPLHILGARNADSEILNIVCESVAAPHERRRATILLPYLLELLQKPNRLGCTPLHYLAENRSCSSSTLERILVMAEQSRPTWLDGKVGPAAEKQDLEQTSLHSAMLVVDEDKENPLHWAMSSGLPPEKFRLLICHGGREALWQTNIFDEFPMDLFAKYCVTNDVEYDTTQQQNYRKLELYLSIIEDCTQQYGRPCGKEYLCGTEGLPLHRIVSSFHFPCPCYLLEMLLRERPSDVMRHDNSARGLLPIHIALSAPSFHQSAGAATNDNDIKVAAFNNETLVFKMLEQQDEAISRLSREGRVALHYAAESNMGLLVIEELLKRYPDALTMNDPLTGLMPFSLAAVNQNSSLDVVYLLLRSYPSNLEGLSNNT